MSTVVTGENVSVEVETSPGTWFFIGCATDFNFEFTNEIIGKTDVNAGLFRKKRIRMSDCRASVQGVATVMNDEKVSVFYFLQESIRRSELNIRLRYEDKASNYITITGIFIVQFIGVTSNVSDFTDYDIQLEGSGGVTLSSVDDPTEVVGCPELKSDTWATTAGLSVIAGSGQNGLSFAGHNVLVVTRAGLVMEIISTGTPGNMQAKYTGSTSITVDPTNPFNDGEEVVVVWEEDGS